MFRRGDLIFHRHHGLGRVQGSSPGVGSGSAQNLVSIRFERLKLDLKLPQARLAECSRAVLDSHQARGVLEHLSRSDKVLAEEYRVRRKNNLERLSSGDPYELCDVIAGLRRLREKQGRLSRTDEEHLRTATLVLADELAVSLDCEGGVIATELSALSELHPQRESSSQR